MATRCRWQRLLALAALLLLHAALLHATKASTPKAPVLTSTLFDHPLVTKYPAAFVLFYNASAPDAVTTYTEYLRVFRSFRHAGSVYIATFDTAALDESEWAEDEFEVDPADGAKLVFIRPGSDSFRTYGGALAYKGMASWISKKTGVQPELDAAHSVAVMQDVFDTLHQFHTVAYKLLQTETQARAALVEDAHRIRAELALTAYGGEKLSYADLCVDIMTYIVENGWGAAEIKKEIKSIERTLSGLSPAKAKRARDRMEIYGSYVSSIPKTVHFIKVDGRPENFKLIHFLAIRSAHHFIKPDKILFHTPSEPTGELWERAKQYVEVVIVNPPYQVNTAKGVKQLRLAAHQSDFMRLDIIVNQGGLYLDWDVISTRSHDDIWASVAVMGMEKKVPDLYEVAGVAALMGRPGSQFMKRFRKEMELEFDGDRCYACHSTAVARRLAMKYPEEIRMLNYTSWYHPGWEEQAVKLLFDPDYYNPSEDMALGYFYGIHLFESHKNYQTIGVPAVTVANIQSVDTHFNVLMRPFVTDRDWRRFGQKRK